MILVVVMHETKTGGCDALSRNMLNFTVVVTELYKYKSELCHM